MFHTNNIMAAVGRVETRPEVVSIGQGGIRVMYSLCVTRSNVSSTARSGWIRTMSSGALAEYILATVRQGDYVDVSGTFRERRWKDSSGKQRSRMELNIERLEILATSEPGRTSMKIAGIA